MNNTIRRRRYALPIAAGLALVGRPARAQETPSAAARADSLEARVRALETRLDSVLSVLARMQAAPGAAAPAPPAGPQDELAALRAAAGRAAAEAAPAAAPSDTAGAHVGKTRGLQALNPEISVTGDFVADLAAPESGDTEASAVPREFEISFQAALDPYTRTKVFVTKEEEFEIAGAGEEPAGGHGGGFEIEEGYMYWVGLPGGIGAKIGKFRQEIGLFNRWHTHALWEVDRPLATRAFLGDDGLIQTGASITLPSFRLGRATQTVWFEATRAENSTLFGDDGDLSYLGRIQSFWDLSPSTYLQVGSTGVIGKADQPSSVSRLAGVDVSLRWAPPNRATSREFSLKGEWYWAERDFGATSVTGLGGYAQARYRLNRQWIAGLRADYVEDFGVSDGAWQLVPSITWWQSEWVRLRLQYHYLRDALDGDNHTFLFQTVWAMGPHKHETY
ncbi:MAG: hypothetical protein ACE5HF_01270 [Gemmatimonadota bacterium]